MDLLEHDLPGKAMQVATSRDAVFTPATPDEVFAKLNAEPWDPTTTPLPPLVPVAPGSPASQPEEDGSVGHASDDGEVEARWVPEQRVVTAAVRGLNSTRAAGGDGVPAALLKAVFRLPGGEEAITAFVAHQAAGNLPKRYRAFAHGGRVVAFRKPGGGVRPILIQPALPALGEAALARAVLPLVRAELSPHQLAVGVAGGAALMGNLIRLQLEALGDDAMLLSLDSKNAYGTLKRQAVQEALQRRPQLKHLQRAFEASYIESTPRVWVETEAGGAWGTARDGVPQGSPLSPMYFCLTIADPLAAAHGAGVAGGGRGRVFAFMDDVVLVGDEAYCGAAAPVLMQQLSTVGMEPNMAKSVVYDPRAHQPGAAGGAAAAVAEGLGWKVESGVVVAGTPFGPPQFIAAWLADRLGRLESDGDALVALDHAFPAWSLLHRCLSRRGQWPALTVPPERLGEYVANATAVIVRTAARILQLGDLGPPLLPEPPDPPPDGAAETVLRLGLPLKVGGMGVTLLTHVADAAWVGAIGQVQGYLSRTAAEGQGLRAQLASPASATHQSALAALRRVTVKAGKPAPAVLTGYLATPLSQKDLSGPVFMALEQAYTAKLRQATVGSQGKELRDGRKAYAAWRSMRAPLSYAWLSVGNGALAGQLGGLKSEVTCLALRLRLRPGQALEWPDTMCPAHNAVRMTTAHAFNCNAAKVWCPRHEALLTEVAVLARRAGWSPDRVNVSLAKASGNADLAATLAKKAKVDELRGDLVVRLGTKRTVLDVTVASCTSSWVSGSSPETLSSPAAAATRAEQKKDVKYKAACKALGLGFHPIALDATGAAGAASSRLLRRLCRAAAVSGVALMDDSEHTLLSRLSFRFHHSQAALLLDHRRGQSLSVIG